MNHYLDTLEQLIPVDREKFFEYFYGYVLMRSIQTFGTYGFRGLFERKEYFIKSIPFAIRNVKWILENAEFPVEMPHLKELYGNQKYRHYRPCRPWKNNSSRLTFKSW